MGKHRIFRGEMKLRQNRGYYTTGYVIKEMIHVLAVHLSSYGCT